MSTWSAPREDERPQQVPALRARERRLHRRDRYTGIRPLLAHWPKWIRLRRRLKGAPGFCGHYVYYKFPFTFGQVVLFEEMDQMLRFARNKLHRELMAWVTEGDGKNAKAGFIRLYDARPGASYANGAWSAEGAAGYDERFTARARRPKDRRSSPGRAADLLESRTVSSSRELDEWIALTDRLYADTPQFIPPLRQRCTTSTRGRRPTSATARSSSSACSGTGRRRAYDRAHELEARREARERRSSSASPSSSRTTTSSPRSSRRSTQRARRIGASASSAR